MRENTTLIFLERESGANPRIVLGFVSWGCVWDQEPHSWSRGAILSWSLRSVLESKNTVDKAPDSLGEVEEAST